MDISKAQKMLLGIAIGDALGKSFEGSKPTIRPPNDDIFLYKGITGVYTDDTQMSLAVAELMLSDFPFNEETLASYFVYAYRRDKRSGYSSLTKSQLEKSWCGMDFVKSISIQEKIERKSDGSAMRAVPIGLFPGLHDVIQYGKINSLISHCHQRAIFASIGIALASHYIYYEKGDVSNIIQYILNKIPVYDYDFILYLTKIDKLSCSFDKNIFKEILNGYQYEGPPYYNVKRVFGVILYILKHFSDEPKEAIKKIISFGGDVDTIMSITLGLLMMFNDFNKLPSSLIDNLENGEYGKDYILSIGKQLDLKFPVNRYL